MKGYLRNLMKALLGINPYRQKIKQAMAEYGLTARNIQQFVAAGVECKEKLTAERERVASYQNLTENLRQRITEKDIEIHRQAMNYQQEIAKMRNAYDKDIKERDERISGLRKELDDTLELLQEATNALADASKAK
jgi:chromosome segregation ATPase